MLSSWLFRDFWPWSTACFNLNPGLFSVSVLCCCSFLAATSHDPHWPLLVFFSWPHEWTSFCVNAGLMGCILGTSAGCFLEMVSVWIARIFFYLIMHSVPSMCDHIGLGKRPEQCWVERSMRDNGAIWWKKQEGQFRNSKQRPLWHNLLKILVTVSRVNKFGTVLLSSENDILWHNWQAPRCLNPELNTLSPRDYHY